MSETISRPRIEGDREQQILEATLDVLVEVGYDRLTLDAVAARAKASKATLYRRWNGKAALVVDALAHDKGPAPEAPDTGSLREDLREAFCGLHGLGDPRQAALFGSIITATTTDPEFSAAFRRDVVGPRLAMMRRIWERAAERGDLREGLDLDILEPALPGILLHRAHLMGQPPTPDVVTRVIDTVVLPAALRPGLLTTPHDTPHDIPHDIPPDIQDDVPHDPEKESS